MSDSGKPPTGSRGLANSRGAVQKNDEALAYIGEVVDTMISNAKPPRANTIRYVGIQRWRTFSAHNVRLLHVPRLFIPKMLGDERLDHVFVAWWENQLIEGILTTFRRLGLSVSRFNTGVKPSRW